MTPTETLKHEHQVILLVLKAAQREAEYIRDTGEIHAAEVEQLVDFFRNFADRCHHMKEERYLFARLKERGMAVDDGPIGVMLMEHDEGRRRIAAAVDALPKAKAGQSQAIAAVKDNLLAYVELLRQHIDKEDNCLYPMANQMLTSQDQQALAQAFEKVEAEEMGEGVHEKYHQLAHELAEV